MKKLRMADRLKRDGPIFTDRMASMTFQQLSDKYNLSLSEIFRRTEDYREVLVVLGVPIQRNVPREASLR